MRTIFFITLAFIFSLNIYAQENGDIKGANDNSLISRFNGSFIKYTNTVKWDTYILPVSKIRNEGGSKTWDKKLKLEGEVNRIQYVTNKENTTSLVYLNYVNALKKSNWDILFKGLGDNELGNESYEWAYYLFGDEGYQLNNKFGSEFKLWGDEHAFIAAGFEDDENSYYTSIYIVSNDEQTIISQDIVKIKNPDLELVTAAIMTDKISKKGHVVLDGIYFNNGEFNILEKSDNAFKNITKYLNANKNNKFFVVGHTDNVGTFQLNMILSENRAKAVLNKLISDYGVNPDQIKSYGVANLSPLVTNKTDAGKAKNRRVEIVKQ